MRLTLNTTTQPTLAGHGITACPPLDVDYLTQDELAGIERRGGASIAAMGTPEGQTSAMLYALAYAWLRRLGAGLSWEDVRALPMSDVSRVLEGYDDDAPDAPAEAAVDPS